MLKRSPALAYGISATVTLGAILLRFGLAPLLGDRFVFITLFPAVAFAAWFGGRGPAILATIIGGVGSAAFLLTTKSNPAEFAGGMVLFALFSGASIFLIETLRASALDAQAQTELLQITLESIGDGVIVTDADHRVSWFNPVAERFTGYKKEEAMGRPLEEVFQIVNEVTREPVPIPSRRALELRQIMTLANHTVLIHKSGSEVAIDDTASPIIDAEGQLVGSVLVFRDVSTRRDREKVFHATFNAAKLLASIIESSEDAIITKNLDGVIQSWNASAERLYGFRSEEVVGKHISLLIPEELRPEEDDIISRLKKGLRIHSYETVRVDKEGERIPVSLTISPIYDDDGNIVGASKIARDISDRRVAEERIGSSESRLRLALEAGKMGVWDWDVATGKLSWTDQLEPLHGLAPGTFGGTFEDFANLVHPQDRQNVTQVIGNALESGSEFYVEFRTIHPGDEIRWIAGIGKVFRNAAQQPYRMLGVGFDVTDRYRSEKSAQFLSDASSVLANVHDPDSTLQQIASISVPGFADWASIDVAEPDGLLRRVAVAHVQPEKVQLAVDLHRRFPPDPESGQGGYSVLRTGEPELVKLITDEMLVASIQDNELLEIARDLGLKSYIAVPLRVRGKIFGVVSFVSAESGHLYDDKDMEVANELGRRASIALENSQLYDELRQTDRRKDEFLATLAHELRNPLAPLQNSVDLLTIAGESEETRQMVLETMQRQVGHMARLVDDLMDVSRITTGKLILKPERISLSTVVDRAVESYGSRSKANQQELRVNKPEVELAVYADAVRLSQAIGNLIDNAAKYTHHGGTIDVDVLADGSGASVKVTDNGQGIPAEMLTRVFDLFTQVEGSAQQFGGGLGIGLSLASRLVEMHGGTLEAESDGLGRGSAFTIRLPLVSDVDQSEPQKDGGTETPKSRRVLVVDDNVDIARSMSLLLELVGYQVKVAHTGEQALEVALEGAPEVVLLDIGLPGMDGHETCRNLRQLPEGEQLVIIALTGWGHEEDRKRSKEAGFDGHLVKPTSYKDVTALVESIIASRGQ